MHNSDDSSSLRRAATIPARGNRKSSQSSRNLSPREYAGRFWHDLRWQFASADSLERWIMDRLQVDPWYWLFILGLNNSGTTFLKRFLSAHPLIRDLPFEGQRHTDALPHPAKLGVRLNWANYAALFRLTEVDDPRPAWRAKYDWARLYPPGPGVLLQKSPPDAVRSRWLQHNFQPSRFLVIIRSPYAVCEGIRRRTGCALREAARHWTSGNRQLLADIDHLEHHLCFTYEEFCERPREHLALFEQFLDLPTPLREGQLEEVSAHSASGHTRGLQNLNFQSLERLTRGDLDVINEVAGSLMERLGYSLL